MATTKKTTKKKTTRKKTTRKKTTKKKTTKKKTTKKTTKKSATNKTATNKTATNKTAKGGLAAFSSSDLARHFSLPLRSVHRSLQKVTGNPDLDQEEVVLLDHDARKMILFVVAESAAQCACGRSYGITEKVCSCGRRLGRCPQCLRYCSFSLVESCWIERDEYRCDECGCDVAECRGDVLFCFGWAARQGDEWLDHCPTCEMDPDRRAEDKERARKMSEHMVDSFRRGWNSADR